LLKETSSPGNSSLYMGGGGGAGAPLIFLTIEVAGSFNIKPLMYANNKKP
jgi:hypothetical protein